MTHKTMTKEIRTRFAPSPSGFLHLGGVRTALFNYLFAKKHDGQFILRIDDTDQQRNVIAALQPILHGLRWLGIQWDEGTEVSSCSRQYYQSNRTDLYDHAIDRLIRGGFAYRDFATKEELQAEKDAAITEGKTFIYSRRWMARTDLEANRFLESGRREVIRLMMPRQGKLVIHDLIRGDVEFDWANEQDAIIRRSSGAITYHLANVVDDEEFEISHVIRAEEHLSNTPRQIFMIQALGYQLPEYAHLPCVAEPGSKTKLSKRKLDKYLKHKDFAKMFEHGISIMQRQGKAVTAENFNPVITDFYKECGYLPEAIINYIALLGWSLDGKTEFFGMDDLIELFSLEGVSKGAASFDPQKLLSFQEKHMATKTIGQKAELCFPYLGRIAGVVNFNTLFAVLKAAEDRIKVAGDILDYTYFFIETGQLKYDKSFEKALNIEKIAWLEQYRDAIAASDDITQPDFKEHHMALRIALTGTTVGVSMLDTLQILGKHNIIDRINRAIKTFKIGMVLEDILNGDY